jgi:hypothetical protein
MVLKRNTLGLDGGSRDKTLLSTSATKTKKGKSDTPSPFYSPEWLLHASSSPLKRQNFNSSSPSPHPLLKQSEENFHISYYFQILCILSICYSRTACAQR